MIVQFKHDLTLSLERVEGNFQTFGDIQEAISKKGFPIEDYTLYEAHTNTYYEPYDRTPNRGDLLLFMTLKSKKVKSGAFSLSELYSIIEKDRELQDRIEKFFNSPYTSVNICRLVDFVRDDLYSNSEEYDEEVSVLQKLEELETRIKFLEFKMQ